jgi:outer membrane receptor for monomeric catechols
MRYLLLQIINWILNSNHTLQFGLNTKYYKINPGSFKPNSSNSLIQSDVLESEQALESAFYIEDEYTIGSKVTLNYGLRYSVFNYLGPKSINEYVEGLPKSEATLRNVIPAADGSILKTYHGPEFRLSARYSFTENMSVKAGYNTLRQYIHMLSNSTSISPTDIWKLSDPNIKPQTGDQVSLGLYRNFKANTIETSVEVYYKNIDDYLDYKSGAVLVLNHAIERDVLKTTGKAYGLEVSIKKLSGKLNGWFSYTYSRTFLKTGTEFASETINRGEFYPANYDKPHDVTLAGNYRLSHRFSVSLNTIYSTGRPITLPIAKFDINGGKKLLYSDRNEYRIPDYFRTDLSLNIEGSHKIKKLAHSSWSLGVYNLTGRKNAFSTYFVAENNRINGYKLSIFGQPIPFLTYNFRF